MILDPATVLVMTALVVVVCTVVFVFETVVRHDNAVSRVWALGYIAGTITTIAYFAWARDATLVWAVAVGNAAHVGAVGCFWLGCRMCNARRTGVATAVVAALAAASAAAVVPGPGLGPTSVITIGVALAAVSALAGAESLRGALGASRTAWAMAAVFVLQAVYDVLRVVEVAVSGSADVTHGWFSTVPSAILSVVFTIVVLAATSVLRAGRVGVRGIEELARRTGGDSGVLIAPQFGYALRGLLVRARQKDELVLVVAVRMGELGQISTAFGGGVAADIVAAWRASVRRHAPAAARVGEHGPDVLLVLTVVETASDARRVADRILQGVFEDLRAVPGVVLPELGIGIALNDTLGDDADALVAAACASAVGGQPIADPADGLDPPRP